MKIVIEHPSDNPANLMRRAGYAFQKRTGDEMGFVRAFGSSGFPRFHVFTRMEGSTLTINLHYDSKKETYGDAKAHHGEYGESKLIDEEVARIKGLLARD